MINDPPATATFNPQPKNPAVRLKPWEKVIFKADLYNDRAKGRCETCDKPVRRFGTVFEIAHLSHIKGYGAGGGDTKDNCLIECFDCHIVDKHGPKWSAKKQ